MILRLNNSFEMEIFAMYSSFVAFQDLSTLSSLATANEGLAGMRPTVNCGLRTLVIS